MEKILIRKPKPATDAASYEAPSTSSTSSNENNACPSLSTSVRKYDYSSIAEDLNDDSPTQPVLKSFPQKMFGQNARAFNSSWYNTRPWLEYSVSRDACFCFPCGKYGVANDRDLIFAKQGF